MPWSDLQTEKNPTNLDSDAMPMNCQDLDGVLEPFRQINTVESLGNQKNIGEPEATSTATLKNRPEARSIPEPFRQIALPSAVVSAPF